MSRFVGVLPFLLFSSSIAAADTYVAPATKPTGYARKTAGKPPAFDEDRIAKFLIGARWEPVFENDVAADKTAPTIEFVAAGGPGAKVDVIKVAVGAIERRARTTIIAVDTAAYELRPCSQKPKFACLYPRPDFRFDAGSNTAIATGVAPPPATSSHDCAALAKRVADLEAKQAAELERQRRATQKMSKDLK